MPDYQQEHIGDGVYATWDGWMVWLDVRGQGNVLTEGPCGPGIALEPITLANLNRFVARQTDAAQKAAQ